MRTRTGPMLGVLLVGALFVVQAAGPGASADGPGSFVEPVHVLHTFRILRTRSLYGWAVSELADVNGDGVADVITGSPVVNHNAGHADVFSGRTGRRLFHFDGVPGDQLSYAEADAGDVDRDGVPDIVIGAPGNGPGHAFVYSGRDGRPLLTLSGVANGDAFGAAVAGAGDVNRDGYADVLVGAPMNDAVGADAGRVYVFSGRTGGRIRALNGAEPGDLFGSGTDHTADVDGDGVPDTVVGAPGAGADQPGSVSLFSGADGARLWRVGPDASGVDLGWFFVAGVGDVNGDHVPDVYGGDFDDQALGAGTGRAYVFSGVDGSVLLRFAGSAAGEGLGPGREAGDVDADGVPDLIVGSYTSPDGAPNAGKVQIFSGADGSVLRTITSTRANEELGFDAVGLGDVNGDHVPDELISAANRSTVYVVAGEPVTT